MNERNYSHQSFQSMNSVPFTQFSAYENDKTYMSMPTSPWKDSGIGTVNNTNENPPSSNSMHRSASSFTEKIHQISNPPLFHATTPLNLEGHSRINVSNSLERALIDELTDSLAKSNQRCDDLQNEIIELKKPVHVRVNKLESYIKSLENQLTIITSQNESNHQKYKEKINDNEKNEKKLKTELLVIQNEYEELSQKHKRSIKDHIRLQKKLFSTRNDLESITTKFLTLEQQLIHTKKRLKDAQLEYRYTRKVKKSQCPAQEDMTINLSPESYQHLSKENNAVETSYHTTATHPQTDKEIGITINLINPCTETVPSKPLVEESRRRPLSPNKKITSTQPRMTFSSSAPTLRPASAGAVRKPSRTTSISCNENSKEI